jgi:DNA repair exonuclease SbcCD nuclease subunit
VNVILKPDDEISHIADIHLGIDARSKRAPRISSRPAQYLQRYALEKVSFVLIAGDLFDARRVEPEA